MRCFAASPITRFFHRLRQRLAQRLERCGDCLGQLVLALLLVELVDAADALELLQGHIRPGQHVAGGELAEVLQPLQHVHQLGDAAHLAEPGLQGSLGDIVALLEHGSENIVIHRLGQGLDLLLGHAVHLGDQVLLLRFVDVLELQLLTRNRRQLLGAEHHVELLHELVGGRQQGFQQVEVVGILAPQVTHPGVVVIPQPLDLGQPLDSQVA